MTLRLLQVLQVVREYLSLRPICEERIDELEDGAEEFISNAAHDDRVIENIEEVQKCGVNRKSNVHLLGIPGKLEYRKGNIERNSGSEFSIIDETAIYRYRKHNTYQVEHYIETSKHQKDRENTGNTLRGKKANPPTKEK